MKKMLLISLTSILFFACMQSRLQQKIKYTYNMGDSVNYALYDTTYGARFYNIYGCCPEADSVPGKLASEGFHNAIYANDTSLWEWVPINIKGFKQTHIYDLKPQYKDTLTRNDGSIIEVPIWIKNPDWVKKE